MGGIASLFGGGSAPSVATPAAPPTPANPPTMADSSVAQTGASSKAKAAGAAMSNIGTTAGGLEQPVSTAPKSLLGG
jgi:hypothetical protein